MFDFLVYLVQSSLCLAALYLIYKVAMSHETLHRLNRVLLLGSILLSAMLPLCRVKVVKEYDAAPALAAIEIDDMVVAEVAELGVDYVSLLKDVAVMLFLAGVAFMLVRLAVSIYSVWRLIHSGKMSVIEEDVTLTVVNRLSSPFSWFGHIVASEQDMQEYRGMILSHELAHIRLRHSWDVMAVDVALCLWWFNPAMWLLRRELQSLHEYQADDAVLNEGIDAKNYQMLLIKRAVGSRLHSVANCLNHSNLKNRITMMCKKTSSRWAATKALLVVPMVAVALSAFATTVYVPREVQDKVSENSVNDKETETSVIRISGGKIYLNNAAITLDELKRNVATLEGVVALQADDNTPMGDIADVKEVLRENGNLRITYREADSKPLVIVGGEKISYDDMSKIDPNTIHSMNVYKDYSKLPKELKISEDEAKNGVIVITLKKEGEGDANVAASEKMIVIADKRESGPQTQTQSSTVSILGNTDATEMTTVKVSTKDGEKPTIIINGEEVPYASLSDIQSDTVESMDVYKLEDGTRVVYIALESNTTIDEALKPNDNLALVSGKVVDKDGEPIIGVIVQVEGTKRGAVTDVLGQFSIYASLDETLTFSYINMETESVKVKSAKKPIVVTLKQE